VPSECEADEGKTKKSSPHQSKIKDFCQLPPEGKLGGYAAGYCTTARKMAI